MRRVLCAALYLFLAASPSHASDETRLQLTKEMWELSTMVLPGLGIKKFSDTFGHLCLTNPTVLDRIGCAEGAQVVANSLERVTTLVGQLNSKNRDENAREKQALEAVRDYREVMLQWWIKYFTS